MNIETKEKKTRKKIVKAIIALNLLIYGVLIIGKIMGTSSNYGESILQKRSNDMIIKTNENYTTIVVPPYLSEMPPYKINLKDFKSNVFLKILPLLAGIGFGIPVFFLFESVYNKKDVRIFIATLGIMLVLRFCTDFTPNKEDASLKNIAMEYSLIDEQDLEEFTELLESKKAYEESQDLVKISIAKTISEKENDIEFSATLVPTDKYITGSYIKTWKTNQIPAKEYFNYIKAYAENSGGEYIEHKNLKERYIFKEHEFTTEKEAQEYIDSLGLSTDKYMEIIKKDYNIKNITIKVPNTAVATTETKLNELLLKYILKKEKYNNIKYANTPMRIFMRTKVYIPADGQGAPILPSESVIRTE